MARRKSNTWVLVVLIVILIALAIFEPSYGWRVRQFLSPSSQVSADAPTLAAQTEVLKAQLAVLQKVSSQLPQLPANYIRAMVYSRYPLNFKNELLINAGSGQGVAAGKAVVFQGIMIGTVEKVFADTALVQTVFDGTFKGAVRVGTKGYDGLLTGGSYPAVGSIAKNAVVGIGDIVYAAAPGSPYGLPIGEIAATSTSPDNLFQQATVNFAYDVNDVQTVLIQQ